MGNLTHSSWLTGGDWLKKQKNSPRHFGSPIWDNTIVVKTIWKMQQQLTNTRQVWLFRLLANLEELETFSFVCILFRGEINVTWLDKHVAAVKPPTSSLAKLNPLQTEPQPANLLDSWWMMLVKVDYLAGQCLNTKSSGSRSCCTHLAGQNSLCGECSVAKDQHYKSLWRRTGFEN